MLLYNRASKKWELVLHLTQETEQYAIIKDVENVTNHRQFNIVFAVENDTDDNFVVCELIRYATCVVF